LGPIFYLRQTALNAPADRRPAGTPTGRRLLDRLWFAASAPHLTIALSVLLAFTFALAALLPQLPAGSDAVASARWLATTGAAYGRFGSFLVSSGLLNLLGTPWTAVLLGLTAFHLALRIAGQARYLLKARDAAPLAPPWLPFELAQLPRSPDLLAPRIEALVAGHPRGFVEAHRSAGDSVALARQRIDAFFERRSWAAVGPLLTYLGPLAIVGGLLWNALGGWRALDVSLTPGRLSQSAAANGLAVTLVAAPDPAAGRPGVLTLARGNATRDTWIDAGRPATWGSVWIAQRSSGPALAVTAQAGSQRLPLQALEEGEGAGETLRLRFGQNQNEQGFAIPSENLAFRVVSYERLPERGIDRPVFLIQGFAGQDATPQLDQLIEDDGAVEWQGVSLSLRRDRYVVVDLASAPGLPLMAGGGLLLLAGAAVVAWGGFTRAWINAAAEGEGALLAVRSAAPAAGQRLVAATVDALANDNPRAARLPLWRLLFGDRRWALAALGAGVALALLLATPAFSLATAGRGLLIAHLALAGIGLGAWLPALAASLRWALSDAAPALEANQPGATALMLSRAGDPGRGLTLAAFPLLVAAVLLGSVWSLFVFALPVAVVAGEMWLLTALCLANAYFHATSSWRPLRAPSWLPALLVALTLAAAAGLALTTGSLLTG
jgi:hypothetical protein